ncbi:hypothetical protein KR009_004447 [Drosophila setifemur]|nr:hypothetical protein KR009_004447 [Drosophila setifemur]
MWLYLGVQANVTDLVANVMSRVLEIWLMSWMMLCGSLRSKITNGQLNELED